MKPENSQINRGANSQAEAHGQGAMRRRAFFTAVTAAAAGGTALAATAPASPLSGEVSAAELKSRLMARIQDELKTADESELHSYDKSVIDHSRYTKA